MINEYNELELLDWQGNIIRPGDTIKLICVEKPKCKTLVPNTDWVNTKLYVLPEHFSLSKPLQNFCLEATEPGHVNVWEEVESREVISSGDEDNPVIHIKMGEYGIMLLGDYLCMINMFMHNLIVTIEGKSDDQMEFFTKYFEL